MKNVSNIATLNKLTGKLGFKVSRFKEVIKKTVPHKHDDYYELIFLREGEGFHQIEHAEYQVAPPEIYFLKPGQMHYWQFTSIPGGMVILFRDSFFDVMKEPGIVDLYRHLSEHTRLTLPEGLYPGTLLDLLLEEYRKDASPDSHVVHGLMRALLGKMAEWAGAGNNLSVNAPSLFDRFRQLLAKHSPGIRKVAGYASMLHTTPQNLNTICRKHSGQSAGELIQAQVLLEAKRYLLHTSNTVNEIAAILRFSDTSNFVKFFRRSEGTTPARFRQQYFH